MNKDLDNLCTKFVDWLAEYHVFRVRKSLDITPNNGYLVKEKSREFFKAADKYLEES